MFQKTSGLITAGLALTLAASLAWSQAPSPKPGGSGGIATGGTFPATFDSEHRPITAGGFVKTGPIVFMNTAEQAGLTVWTHKAGTPEKRFILEAKGPGVALLDYDNDGWLDIYLVNGSTVDALAGKEPRRMPRSSTTITTAPSPTSPRTPALPTTDGDTAS